MKIKTKIVIGILLSVLSACSAGYYIVVSMNSFSASIASIEKIDVAVRGLFQLNRLTSEYSRYHIKRASKQWKIQYAENERALSEISLPGNGHDQILNSIRGELPQALILFEKLEKVHATIHQEHREDDEGLLQLDEQLTGRIFAINQSMLDGANKLFNAIHSDVGKQSRMMTYLVFSFLAIVLCVIFALCLMVQRSVIRPLNVLQEGILRLGQGDLDYRLPQQSRDEIGTLAGSFNEMTHKLQSSKAERDEVLWLQSSLNNLGERLRGEKDIAAIGSDVLDFMSSTLDMIAGVVYVNGGDDIFRCAATYALHPDVADIPDYPVGRGLVGQAAVDKEIVRNEEVSGKYFVLSSGLGERTPAEQIVIPLIHNETAVGVLELAFAAKSGTLAMSFLQQAADSISVRINECLNRQRIQVSFGKEKELTEQLRLQQKELQVANRELMEKAESLQVSEEELRVVNEELEQQSQQLRASEEELRVTNEELQQKSDSLLETNVEITRKNQQLETSQQFLQEKTAELESSSRYKSEFLATVSHELRTPLNSILILSQDLAGNNGRNLSPEQVESAEIIYNSGNDLLQLINDILDLSKIEAGKMCFSLADLSLDDLVQRIEKTFRSQVERKNLSFLIRKAGNLPAIIRTDHSRLEQVVKNLVSNAIKFTARGSVSLDIHPAERVLGNGTSEQCLGLTVADTGIGIPKEQQSRVFEAFYQGDGSISRQYGGTGLGLSISKEMIKVLGGEIIVDSEPGKGTRFTVLLPLGTPGSPDLGNPAPAYAGTSAERIGGVVRDKFVSSLSAIEDDRAILEADDLVILVIEDDPVFAMYLYNFSHRKGFKCIHATDGETGIEFANRYLPAAVILDNCLPGIQGYTVLENLQGNELTRHIPVHMISAVDIDPNVLDKGAVGFLQKPLGEKELEQAFGKISSIVTGAAQRLLIVEDNDDQRKSLVKLVANSGVLTDAAATGAEALEMLRTQSYDCMVLDLMLPDMSGLELLEKVKGEGNIALPPVVVYTGKEISAEEEEDLRVFTSSVIIKGVKSPDRLLDEIALFLHRVSRGLPSEKLEVLQQVAGNDDSLTGRTILIVDDDMRNVFAMSKVLADKGMQVLKAANGQKGLDILEREDKVDLVLMDIMMPVMDGFTAIESIRRSTGPMRKVPIIALTAKAMKEDRKKCLDVGANDYMAKPVDMERLMTLIRVWLTRKKD